MVKGKRVYEQSMNIECYIDCSYVEGRLTYLCEDRTPPLGCFVPKKPYIDSALVKSFKGESEKKKERRKSENGIRTTSIASTSILQAACAGARDKISLIAYLPLPSTRISLTIFLEESEF